MGNIQFSLRTKLTVLIITISFVLITIAATTSYQVHAQTVDDYYKALVSQVGKSGAAMLDADRIGEFLTLVKSSEYQDMLSGAIQNGDEAAVRHYLEEKGMYQDFVEINARLDELQKTWKSNIFIWNPFRVLTASVCLTRRKAS